MRFLLALMLLAGLSACVQTSQILVGTARDPIPVENVRIYHQEPKRHEKIALLQSTSKDGLTQQMDTDMALDALKKQAAALGANGILIQALDGGGNLMSGTAWNFNGGGATVFSGGYLNTASIRAIAIYVP